MEKLMQEIKELENKLSDLKAKARKYCDGHRYVTELHCYGSLHVDTHTNEYAVQELCNEYYGDNGIVHVYTTNPDHNISNRGGDVTYIHSDVIIKLIDPVLISTDEDEDEEDEDDEDDNNSSKLSTLDALSKLADFYKNQEDDLHNGYDEDDEYDDFEEYTEYCGLCEMDSTFSKHNPYGTCKCS